MPDILITEHIRGSAVKQLEADFEVVMEPSLWKSKARLLELLPKFRAIIIRNQTIVNEELLTAAPRLEVIGRLGVGMDNIDVPAVNQKGIVIAFAPEQNAISVAELTLGLMLSLARMIPAADRHVKGGGWERQRFTGTELYGKTLGILGLGRIGTRVAVRARAFGMNILAHDSYASPDGITVTESGARLVGLDELLAKSDFVSCHLPLTKETRGLLDYDRFCRMRATALFINASRGEVVAEEGLVRALREKRIAGAALDVREKEPPAHSPIHEMDNVLLTPHIGAYTAEAQERVVSAVCHDVAAVLRGQEARNCFNFPRPRKT